MKHTLTAVLIAMGATMGSMAAQATQEITPTDISCADLQDRYQLTAEGRERLQNFIGACQSVVKIDGTLYATTKAVVRSAGSKSVRLYIPATDRTIEVNPQSDLRVNVDGRKMRPRDLERGQEITIHVAVDSVAEPVPMQTVAMDVVPEAASDTPVVEQMPVTELAALPTTASPLPLIGLIGLCLLGLAGMLRLRRV